MGLKSFLCNVLCLPIVFGPDVNFHSASILHNCNGHVIGNSSSSCLCHFTPSQQNFQSWLPSKKYYTSLINLGKGQCHKVIGQHKESQHILILLLLLVHLTLPPLETALEQSPKARELTCAVRQTG